MRSPVKVREKVSFVGRFNGGFCGGENVRDRPPRRCHRIETCGARLTTPVEKTLVEKTLKKEIDETNLPNRLRSKLLSRSLTSSQCGKTRGRLRLSSGRTCKYVASCNSVAVHREQLVEACKSFHTICRSR